MVIRQALSAACCLAQKTYYLGRAIRAYKEVLLFLFNRPNKATFVLVFTHILHVFFLLGEALIKMLKPLTGPHLAFCIAKRKAWYL
jgi:hypothetical protein